MYITRLCIFRQKSAKLAKLISTLHPPQIFEEAISMHYFFKTAHRLRLKRLKWLKSLIRLNRLNRLKRLKRLKRLNRFVPTFWILGLFCHKLH